MASYAVVRTAAFLLVAWWILFVSMGWVDKRHQPPKEQVVNEVEKFAQTQQRQQQLGGRGGQRQRRNLLFSSNEPKMDSYHKIVGVGGPVAQIVRLTNGLDRPDDGTQDVDFMTGLGQLRATLVAAAAANIRIRAHGSRWSQSNILYSGRTGLSLDCGGLNYAKVGVDDPATHLTETYRPLAKHIVMVQAGVYVQRLNDLLLQQSPRLSLTTMGDVDQQRFVGAVSTDTHGSELEAGADGTMSGMVRAVHILLGPSGSGNKEVLIQAQPIFTEAYATTVLAGATLITDESLFRAVLAGAGNTGIIHAMLIEAVPLFTLEQQLRRISLAEARTLLSSNFATMPDLGFVGYGPGASIPKIVYLRANPFRRDENAQTLVLKVYRRLDSDGSVRSGRENDKVLSKPKVLWDDNHGLAKGVTFLSNKFIRFFVSIFNGIFWFIMTKVGDLAVGFGDDGADYGVQKNGYLAEFFRMEGTFDDYSIDPFPSLSYEFAVPLDRLLDAYQVITDTLEECPFVLRVVIMRITLPSSATLSPAVFAPYTAYLDIESQADKFFFRELPCSNLLIEKMGASGIPHRMHLGKYHPENAEWFSRQFGTSTVDTWKAERRKLLDTSVLRERFANDWLVDVGLHEP